MAKSPKLEREEHINSLDPAFDPRMPVGADLSEAFKKLLEGLFGYLYPAHPEFDAEVRPALLRDVLQMARAALAAPEGRVPVPDRRTREHVRAIANPLRLATVGESHFFLEPHWCEHFNRQRAMLMPGEAMTVKMLRKWTDLPQRRGLTREVQNLLILVYAEQANLSFVHNDGVAQPALDDLKDELVLREETLPPEAEWVEAVRRVQALFALTPAELRNASNLARLVDSLRAIVRSKKPILDGFCRDLGRHLKSFGVDGEPDRLRTARSAQRLLSALGAADAALAFVSALATAKLETSETAVGRTVAKADELSEALRTASWEVIEGLGKLTDERQTAAAAIFRRVAEILSTDEHAIGLRAALAEASRDAVRLLTDVRPKPQPPEPPPPPPAPGRIVIDSGQETILAADEAEAILTKLAHRLRQDTSLRIDLSWCLSRSDKA